VRTNISTFDMPHCPGQDVDRSAIVPHLEQTRMAPLIITG